MNRIQPLRAYFGHHKCASTWISLILQLVCDELQLTYKSAHAPEVFEYDLNRYLNENHIDFFSYTNANIKHVKKIDNFLGFHVIRDPRDIIVSGYYSHLYSHPIRGWLALVDHRNKLKELSKEDGLLLEMEFVRDRFEDLYNWDYTQKNVLEMKMEELIRSPYNSILEAMTFLEMVDDSPRIKHSIKNLLITVLNRINAKTGGWIPYRIKRTKIPAERLLGHIFQKRFSKLSKGRDRGQEDTKSHYRKGISGDWVNHFSQEHIRFFKEEYNDLLIKLGYEKTSAW
ncbi:sulfotransferase domain-containing protein [Rhodohalobacter sp. 614A]|uniref:sulfotransferase domain-containing protein n=1 Tax=Rhodohalobacter sp. 614A TaxID=2908649 RepID=UPI001F46B007|nr:sulfotransferase domain-containing protein [Rhodohalobacter sp. 614A]